MRNVILAAGVAALAIAAPAMAERGGKGGGNKGEAAKVEHGGGKARAQKDERGHQHARAAKVERRGGGERVRFAALSEERGRGKERAEVRGRSKEKARVRVEDRRDRKVVRVERRDRNEERIALRRNGERDRIVVRERDRDRDRDRLVLLRDRDREFVRIRELDDWRDDDRRFARRFANRGIPAAFIGCPPGLAKKEPECLPPGLAKEQFLGRRLPATFAPRVLPLSLRNIYRDDDDFYYRWGDGYVYRVRRDNDFIAALLPLVGGGFGLGQPFPHMGQSYFVPSYYQPFYADSNDDYYRYANGYVYEIDRDTGLIEDIIPLLDRGYGVGQIMPASYSYYNVPYQYRSMYYDTPDYYYRYAPGAIYQVDRDSSLITAVASLLTGGLTVGQPLPPAYGAYNVPLAYRATYYDTPDSWYRYNNGYIYQVDPTTQLITAIVRAIV